MAKASAFAQRELIPSLVPSGAAGVSSLIRHSCFDLFIMGGIYCFQMVKSLSLFIFIYRHCLVFWCSRAALEQENHTVGDLVDHRV